MEEGILAYLYFLVKYLCPHLNGIFLKLYHVSRVGKVYCFCWVLWQFHICGNRLITLTPLSYVPSSIRDSPPPSWSSSTYIAFGFVTEFDQGHLLTIYLELSTGTQWTHLWVHNRRQFFFHSQNLLVVSSS